MAAGIDQCMPIPYHAMTTVTSTSRIARLKTVCPSLASTIASGGTDIFPIIFFDAFTPAMGPLMASENDCHKITPISANTGYGIDAVCVFKISALPARTNVSTTINGGTKTHTYPKRDWRYWAFRSRTRSLQATLRARFKSRANRSIAVPESFTPDGV